MRAAKKNGIYNKIIIVIILLSLLFATACLEDKTIDIEDTREISSESK